MQRHALTALIVWLCSLFPLCVHGAVKGDVNNDGQITLKDAIAALRVIGGTGQGADPAACVDGSGKIGMPEAIYALQCAAHLRSVPAAAGAVSQAGGTVEVTDAASPIFGAKVIVPEGATEAGETVTIEIRYQDALPGPVNTNTPEAVPAGRVVSLTKSGPITFQKPVEVVWPYDDAQLGEGDIPSVLCWNEAENKYVAAEVIAIDRAAKTVTFQTTHFSNFVLAVMKGLYQKLRGTSYPAISTGFKPDVDGFFHANDTFLYSVGLGACVGMSSYAAWYYTSQKAIDGLGLYAKYRQGVPESWEDDKIARELLVRAALASSQSWMKIQMLTSLADATGLLLLQNLQITGAPQLMAFNYGLTSRHAVVVYGYDGAGKFQVYDPNYPGRNVTVDWSPFTGLSNYSDPPPGVSTVFNYTHHGISTLFKRQDFENFYAGAENGWSGPLFNTIGVASPALDADDAATVEIAPGENITLQGTVGGGSVPAQYLGYCIIRSDPLPRGFLPAGRGVLNLAANGGFALTRPYGAGTYWIVLLATNDPIEASQFRPHAYAGMKQVTLKVVEKPAPAGALALPVEAYDVAVAGTHAYVIDKSFGLRVVDVADAAAPSLKASLGLTPYKYGRSIFLSGSYAYFGVGYMGIIDIADPGNPIELAGSSAGDASDVVAVGSVAYVAGGGSSTPVNGVLFSFDVSEPDNLFKDRSLSRVDFAGSDIRGVAVAGNHAYALDPIGGRLYVVDIANPAAMQKAAEVFVGGSDSIWCGIFAANDKVYVITKNTFAIVDVAKPREPAILSTMAAGYGRDVVVAGPRAYVLGANYLAVYDVTDPRQPYFNGSIGLTGTGVKLAVAGGYAYVAQAVTGGTGALAIYRTQ
jgi:hypothetical protein